MQELDDLDDLARERMFNIRFCATVCWIRPGLAWAVKWDTDAIDECSHLLPQLDEPPPPMAG